MFQVLGGDYQCYQPMIKVNQIDWILDICEKSNKELANKEVLAGCRKLNFRQSGVKSKQVKSDMMLIVNWKSQQFIGDQMVDSQM